MPPTLNGKTLHEKAVQVRNRVCDRLLDAIHTTSIVSEAAEKGSMRVRIELQQLHKEDANVWSDHCAKSDIENRMKTRLAACGIKLVNMVVVVAGKSHIPGYTPGTVTVDLDWSDSKLHTEEDEPNPTKRVKRE